MAEGRHDYAQTNCHRPPAGVAGGPARDGAGLIRPVGWCIIDTKTISGRIDSDGKRSDDFEGCDFGRKILFLDGTYLTCSSYSYTYSYMPEATILARKMNYRGKSITLYKMVVEGESHDMTR